MTYPTVMSNMLLPTELETAMSPRPLRATITLVIRSGMDVPAAKMVRPIISSEMPMVSPTLERKKKYDFTVMDIPQYYNPCYCFTEILENKLKANVNKLTWCAHHTMRYEKIAIHTIEPRKVITKYFLDACEGQ